MFSILLEPVSFAWLQPDNDGLDTFHQSVVEEVDDDIDVVSYSSADRCRIFQKFEIRPLIRSAVDAVGQPADRYFADLSHRLLSNAAVLRSESSFANAHRTSNEFS